MRVTLNIDLDETAAELFRRRMDDRVVETIRNEVETRMLDWQMDLMTPGEPAGEVTVTLG